MKKHYAEINKAHHQKWNYPNCSSILRTVVHLTGHKNSSGIMFSLSKSLLHCGWTYKLTLEQKYVYYLVSFTLKESIRYVFLDFLQAHIALSSINVFLSRLTQLIIYLIYRHLSHWFYFRVIDVRFEAEFELGSSSYCLCDSTTRVIFQGFSVSKEYNEWNKYGYFLLIANYNVFFQVNLRLVYFLDFGY